MNIDTQSIIASGPYTLPAFSLTPEALRARNEALSLGAFIGRVQSASENEFAVKAVMSLHEAIKAAEETYDRLNRPMLDCQKTLREAVKNYTAPMREEKLRVETLCADFLALEVARAKSEEAARNEGLSALEKERAERKASAKTHDELDAIDEEFNERLRREFPPAAIAKAGRQTFREEWDVEVIDPLKLAKAHPQCVKMTPMRSEITQLLDAGLTLPGVIAKKVPRAGVRSKRGALLEAAHA